MSLPEYWEILPFTNCLKKVKTKKKSSIPKRDYQESGEFPVIDQGALFIAGWTDSDEYVISDNLPVVIFGDHTRIFKYVDFPFALGADGTQLLYANDEILDPRFFYYALLNLKVPNKGYNRHYRYLREFSVVCPPLPEQRAITHVLQTIQEAKVARQRELALERERKAALMDYLFSHGTKGEPRKQTKIGEIPESWDVVELNKVCSKIVDCPHSTPRFLESGVLCARNFNIRSGIYVREPASYTSEAEYLERIKRLIPQEGDVLFSREAPIGEACLLPPDTRLSLGQRMMLLRVNPSMLDGYFLVQSFYVTPLRSKMLSLGRGATAKHLNVGDVKCLEMLIPSLNEQQKISEVLQACDTKIAALEQEVEQLNELFHTMLDELMTGQRSAVSLIDAELPN